MSASYTGIGTDHSPAEHYSCWSYDEKMIH